MTPKEKAIQLVDKYTQYVTEINEYEYAKKCALIAVDLILTEHPMANDYFYWQEVKQEIEKL